MNVKTVNSHLKIDIFETDIGGGEEGIFFQEFHPLRL